MAAWLIPLFALLSPFGRAAAEPTSTVYLFPVQFEKTERVNEQERNWIRNVFQEEMGAFFWMKPIYGENARSVLGGAASAVLACKNPRCAFSKLKAKGVDRLAVIRVKREGRRAYRVSAAVHGTSGGKVILSYDYLERGGPTELKYAIPGVLEQLFHKELQQHSNRVTSIVESTAVTSTGADDALDKGDKLAREGDLDSALAKYDEAASASPELSLPWVKKAELLLGQENEEEALAAAKKALSIDPKDARANLVLAQILMNRKKYRKAQAALETAIKTDGKLLKAHFLMGTLSEKSGNMKQAVRAFQKVVDMAPESPEARMNLGLILLKAKKTELAIKHLKKAIHFDENFFQAYPPLAQAHEADKAWTESAHVYEDLGNRMGKCAQCFTNAGMAYEQAGDGRNAMGAYEKAIELDENALDAYYNLGAMLHRFGDAEEARPYLEAYVERETRPEQEAFIKQARKMLAGAK